MAEYSSSPISTIHIHGSDLHSFTKPYVNADEATLTSFAEEWKRFGDISAAEQELLARDYFDLILASYFPLDGNALDIGCGSGRWSAWLSGRCRRVEALDAGDAVLAAAHNLRGYSNVRVTQAGFGNIPFAPCSFDFILSVGVIHHLPDTMAAIREVYALLKPGGRCLLYAYYDVRHRSLVYRMIFKVSEAIRYLISSLPLGIKFFVSNCIFWLGTGPITSIVKLAKMLFPRMNWWKRLPLGYYHDKSWRIIKSDTLDRFCTPLAKRFSKEELQKMMVEAGFRDIVFSEKAPFWHFTAIK